MVVARIHERIANRRHNFAHQTSWNRFITITEKKAEEAGSRVIPVNPRNTSQQCSRCGMFVAKMLSDRVHSCPHCGLVMDRVQNAAINIMGLGLQSQG